MVDHSSQNGRTSRFDVTILVTQFTSSTNRAQAPAASRLPGIPSDHALLVPLTRQDMAYLSSFSYLSSVMAQTLATMPKAHSTLILLFPGDSDNKPINEIVDFAEVFLTPTHLTEMIARLSCSMSPPRPWWCSDLSSPCHQALNWARHHLRQKRPYLAHHRIRAKRWPHLKQQLSWG